MSRVVTAAADGNRSWLRSQVPRSAGLPSGAGPVVHGPSEVSNPSAPCPAPVTSLVSSTKMPRPPSLGSVMYETETSICLPA